MTPSIDGGLSPSGGGVQGFASASLIAIAASRISCDRYWDSLPEMVLLQQEAPAEEETVPKKSSDS